MDSFRINIVVLSYLRHISLICQLWCVSFKGISLEGRVLEASQVKDMAPHLMNHGKGIVFDIPVATVIGHNHEVIPLGQVLGLDCDIPHSEVLNAIGCTWTCRKAEPIFRTVHNELSVIATNLGIRSQGYIF